jgi:thiol-disulfide isomerase/thioredoxin
MLMLVFRTLIAALSLFTFSCFTYADVLLKDNQGNNIPFSTLKGKWVFINYWASWCPGCLEEIPQFNRFFNSHKNDEIALFAVNFDGLSVAEQNSLIKRFHIQYPSLVQDPSDALHLGDIRGIPVTFVFNPQGKLVKTLYGGQTAKDLNRVMASR